MSYNGRHPNLYDGLSEKEVEEIRVLDSIIHRREPPLASVGGGADGSVSGNGVAGGDEDEAKDDGGVVGVAPSQVILADDSSSDGEDEDENAAMLEEAGLLFKRPVILQEGLRDEFQGRQAVSRFFDLMDENRRIDAEQANKPPPTYYWTPGHEDKYQDLGAWGKIKHNLHWVGYKAFWGLAFVGEVAVNVLGLDQPEYQWMLEEAEKDRKKNEERKRLQAQRRAYLLERKLAEEAGESDSDEESGSDSDDSSDSDSSSGGGGGGGARKKSATRRGGLKHV